MRIPIYESKLIKTTRFEPEELEKIEHVMKTIELDARENREDPPSESEVIRMLVRLGLESLYNRRRPSGENPLEHAIHAIPFMFEQNVTLCIR